MVLKPVSGPKCYKHQVECTFNCGWCSKPICEECVDAAHGKKYCDKCWEKKSQMKPAMTEPSAPKPAGPRTPIRNVDPSVNPMTVEQQRAAAQKSERDKLFEL